MKISKEIINDYYKYNFTSFVQPRLTSNISNPDFITDRYNVFDGNTSTGYNQYIARGKPNCTTKIILSKDTCFTTFTANQARDTDDNKRGLQYILYGSKDDVNYVTIYASDFVTQNSYTFTFTNNEYYKYYKFYATTYGGYDNDRINFREVSFGGTVRTVVNATESDYDFILSGGKYSAVLENECYKAYKF